MKKSKGIIISILIILLVFVSTIAATYSVIINVVSNNGINEIVNVITIRDLMTDNDGVYNNTYYIFLCFVLFAFCIVLAFVLARLDVAFCYSI